MFKKIFLITVLCVLGSPEKIYSNDQNKAVVAILAGIGAVGTTIYWMNRENNDALIARAKFYIQKNKQALYQIETGLTEENMIASQNTLNCDLKDLRAVYYAISSRYDSYLKPWNWTYKMLVVRDELSTIIKTNDEMLSKVSYLLKIREYQQVLQSIHDFITDYKDILDQEISFCASVNGLQQIFAQKKLIQNRLKLFFARAEILDSRLTGILAVDSKNVRAISLQDRNTEIENNFNSIKEQAACLKIVLKYSECILNINQETKLVKEARKVIGSSSYPLKDFVDMLQRDIYLLKNMDIVRTLYVQIAIDLLQDVKDTSISCDEYISELRAYEMYLEKQRQVEAAVRQSEAAERQARAAQEAANAAQRAARATEDAVYAAQRQARAAEEKNRIEQERNNIERSKQQNNNNNNNNNNRW